MTKKKIEILSVTLISLVVIGYILSLIAEILPPFITGIVVAYLFNPVLEKVHRKFHISKSVSSFAIITGFFLGFFLILKLIIPILYNEIMQFASRLPMYLEKTDIFITKHFGSLLEVFYSKEVNISVANLSSQLTQYTDKVIGFFVSLAKNLFLSTISIINILSLVFITPIISFYLLKDWDRILKSIDNFLPTIYKHQIKGEFKKIDTVLSAYLRGQINVCLILAVYYTVSLVIFGLNYSLIIGFISGILTFIPYVGVGFSITLAIVISLFQWGFELFNIGIIIAIFVIGQVLEGNFITPKLIGNKVGLHPVWIIFGIFVCGALFGFVGIIFAVPITAVAGVLIKSALKKYKKYSGNENH